ncbi:MAG: hypothetical protein HYV07_16790 [Deltaproteobacteria bacterium]|nr:hypothetical protein [Deltaproteobacteria bacterium]
MLAVGCAPDRLLVTLPPEASAFRTAIFTLADGSNGKANAFDPSDEKPHSLELSEVDPGVLVLSLALYDEPAARLGIELGALAIAKGAKPCELAEPELRLESEPGSAVLGVGGASSSVELRFLRDASVPCTRLVCQFSQPSRVHLRGSGSLNRAQLIDETHVLLASNRGVELLELPTMSLETVVEDEATDAFVFGDQLYVLGPDRNVRRGPLTGPLQQILPAIALPGPLSGGTLVVSGDPGAPRIFTLMSWTVPNGLAVLVERHVEGHSAVVIERTQSRGGPGRLELVVRGPDSVVGVTASEELIEIADGESRPALPPLPLELDGVDARAYGVAFLAPDVHFMGTQGGAIWRSDQLSWVNIRNRLRGTGIAALARTADGVFFSDETGASGFVHDELGECWDGHTGVGRGNTATFAGARVVVAGNSSNEDGFVVIFDRDQG